MTDEHLQYHHRSTPGPPRRPAPPPAPGPRPRPADPGRQGRRVREGAAQPRGRARLPPVDPAAGAARTRSPRLAGHTVAGCLGPPDGAAARDRKSVVLGRGVADVVYHGWAH